MPIYEYECSNCHHHFDLMQKINDPEAKQCPKCFMETVTRLISPAGFQLKGTGWYATDYKDKPRPAAGTQNDAESAGQGKESKTTPDAPVKKGDND